MVEILVFEIDGYILRGIHRRIRNLHRYRNGLARACLHLIIEESIGGAVDRQPFAPGHSNHHVFYVNGAAGIAELEGQVEFGAGCHTAAGSGLAVVSSVVSSVFFFTLAGIPILAEASPAVVETLL